MTAMTFLRQHPPRHRPPARRGFTLMELLVVLGIFSMVVVSTSDIFLLTSKSQRKVFSLERTQADARYTMEALTREARSDIIDYAYYGGTIVSPTEALALIDVSTSTNTRIRFEKSTQASQCVDVNSSPCLLVTIGSGSAVPITPKGVAVRNVKFYIAPATDPMAFSVGTGAYGSNLQPRVTIVLMLESTNVRVGESSLVYFQTTVANRNYRR